MMQRLLYLLVFFTSLAAAALWDGLGIVGSASAQMRCDPGHYYCPGRIKGCCQVGWGCATDRCISPEELRQRGQRPPSGPGFRPMQQQYQVQQQYQRQQQPATRPYVPQQNQQLYGRPQGPLVLPSPPCTGYGCQRGVGVR